MVKCSKVWRRRRKSNKTNNTILYVASIHSHQVAVKVVHIAQQEQFKEEIENLMYVYL